jgi:DNA repair protein RecN (Recombination protein N)
MLTKLIIDNIALVEHAELEFHPGLSVLTGETGAGKSVIVTAISLALGERAEREYIRAGETRAAVEAAFDVTAMSGQYRKDLEEFIIDNQFIVEREIYNTGASKVRLNGKVSTLAQLKQLTEPLAEILGQHAGQMLMSEENHLFFLDHFASLEDLRGEVEELFRDWQAVNSELKKVRSRRQNIAKDRELLLYQKNEIEKARIEVGEEEQLTADKKILDSSRHLMEAASAVQNMLDDEEGSALTFLRQAHREMEKMAEVDESLKTQLEQLVDIDFRLEELRQFVEKYGSAIQDDPERLEEINARLNEIYQLKRKYGGSEEAILQTLEEINQRLQVRPDTDEYIRELEKKNERMREAYTDKALNLTKIRRTAALYLKKLVVKELAELAIDNGGFEFQFLYDKDPEGIRLDQTTVRPYPHGLESGRFLFSANPGEPLKSLVKTASGGEISRVLLALKSAEKKNNNLLHSLLIFDEVDAGIGGQTAVEVGRKLQRLSAGCQLIVVTHLHQIAREANHHYAATKMAKKDARTTISVEKIEGKAIDRELDRMVALPQNAR